jgi:hypothetical protein
MVRRSKLPKLKKGMQSEQIAILYLIEKGFFVFKNLYGLGPADLIAIDETGKVEIKKLKMKFIFVDKDGLCKVRQR